jgi:phospholipase A2-like protein
MTRRGKLGLAAVLGAVLSCVLIVAPAPAATTNDKAATVAAEELARTGRAAAPGDFAQVMGYTPVVARLADGRLRSINPDGFCSVPGEGRPFAFATPCQAHDYGYDLLRYAQRRGEPLTENARAAIDARLIADLRSQCDDTTTGSDYTACSATADVFAAGVDFNSWRQMYAPPIESSGLPRTGGLVLLVIIAGLVAAHRVVRRRTRAAAAG